MSPWQPFSALQDPTPSSLPAIICDNSTVLNIDDGVAPRFCSPRSHPLSLWSSLSLSVTAHIFSDDFPSFTFHCFSFHISFVTLAPVVAAGSSFHLPVHMSSLHIHDDTPLLSSCLAVLLSPCLCGPPLGWLLLAAPVPPTLSLNMLFIGPQRGWLSVQGVCCLEQSSLNKRVRSSLWLMCSLSVFVNRH